MGQLDFKGIYIQQPGSLCVFCLRFCVNELLFLQKTNCLRHFKWNKIWHKNFGIEKKYIIKELYIMHLKFVLLWSEVWVKYCRSNNLKPRRNCRFWTSSGVPERNAVFFSNAWWQYDRYVQKRLLYIILFSFGLAVFSSGKVYDINWAIKLKENNEKNNNRKRQYPF